MSGVRTVLRLLGRDRTPGHTIFLAITVMMERRVVRKQPGVEAYWCNIILHFSVMQDLGSGLRVSPTIVRMLQMNML